MRVSNILLLTGGLTLLASCQKFLDVKPKGKLIPAEIEDFNHLLDNPDIVQYPFLDNNGGSMLAYLTDNVEVSEGMAVVNYRGNNSPNLSRYYAHVFRMPYKNPATIDYFWEWGTYRAMKYLNNVIDGINGVKTADNAAMANPVLAQAYTSRAWAYFNTTLVYGPVYKPGGNNSTRTIPYLTSADVNASMPDLSTQEEVFAKVLADLRTALPLAPVSTNYPSRPNKTATQAMLAYYFLFTRQYDSVVHYANLAWTAATAAGGADKVIYDFNQLSYADAGNVLTSAVRSADNLIHLPTSKEILFFRSPDNNTGCANNSYPSDEFMGLFDKTSDLRYRYYLLTAPGYKTTFNGVTYDDGSQVQYYRGALSSGATSGTPKFQMTAGFTYPEVLLMRAEGYARTNKLAEAVADLNILRKYRYATGTPELTVPASQDAAIQLVLDERRRELPLGHQKRFMDLKRFALETDKPWGKAKVVHAVGTNQYEATIDSEQFIIPIGNTVLLFNPQWGIAPDYRPY